MEKFIVGLYIQKDEHYFHNLFLMTNVAQDTMSNYINCNKIITFRNNKKMHVTKKKRRLY